MKFKLWFKITIFLILLIPASFLIRRFFIFEERELIIQYPIPVELVVDGLGYQTLTNSNKIGDFLEEKGIERYSKDLVSPDPEQELRPGSIVNIVTNRKVIIEVDGETREVDTIRKTIEKLLQDERIKLNPFECFRFLSFDLLL